MDMATVSIQDKRLWRKRIPDLYAICIRKSPAFEVDAVQQTAGVNQGQFLYSYCDNAGTIEIVLRPFLFDAYIALSAR